jgi:hypothetical protein
MDRKRFETLAAEWLVRSFDEPSPMMQEACVHMASMCDAMAEFSERLNRLSVPDASDSALMPPPQSGPDTHSPKSLSTPG